MFDVERPDPNDNTKTITERRMKLVRGSDFANTMSWGDINSWSSSNLNTFLNGDYLIRERDASTYGLKQLSQLQIEDVVYYLGGRTSSFPEQPYYGSTKDIYEWERGNTLCGGCESDTSNLKWIGKVALMYSSDYAYTYSKGVDDNCYNDPSQCFLDGNPSGNPNFGWIFNSNNFEKQDDIGWNYLLNGYSTNSDGVFATGSNGKLYQSGICQFCTAGIRPVLYLSSSVNIIDGDGSSSNPYKLSL